MIAKWVNFKRDYLEISFLREKWVCAISPYHRRNVRMREMCWHGDLTQSRCAQQKPLNRDCPRQAGAFDDRVDGRS